MIVPVWPILTAVAVAFVLVLAAILMFFEWKGMELENRELRERLMIVQIDVSGMARRKVDQPSRAAPDQRTLEQVLR